MKAQTLLSAALKESHCYLFIHIHLCMRRAALFCLDELRVLTSNVC